MTCRDLQPVDRLRPMSSIVIIEEDDLMRGLLTEWLTGAGYAVRERGLRAAQQAYPGAPVIAMSAQFRPGLDCSARAAGALGVSKLVCKPFTREDLLGAVRALIGPAP